jgi:hypothetical protein
MDYVQPVETPEFLSAVRVRQKAPGGHLHVIIAIDPKTGRELEIFALFGKAGTLPMSSMEAVGRMASSFLRIGGTIEQVADQLKGIGSNNGVPSEDGPVMSLGDALGRAVQKYLDAKQKHGLEMLLTGEVDLEAEEAEDATAIPTTTEADGKVRAVRQDI